MKKKIIFITMIVFALFMSVACSDENNSKNSENKETPQENHSSENELEKIEDDEIENGNEITPIEEPPQKEQNSIDKLKNTDLLGNNSDQVKNQLGEPKVDHKDSVMHAWRYDFATSNYDYDNELISVDVSGLTNGLMEAQLFVYFEENVVTSYSIYYLKDEEIMQYRVTKDGAEEFSASAD